MFLFYNFSTSNCSLILLLIHLEALSVLLSLKKLFTIYCFKDKVNKGLSSNFNSRQVQIIFSSS
jgi:hypothetical protein